MVLYLHCNARLTNSSNRIGASLLDMLQWLNVSHRTLEYKDELREKIFQFNFDPDDPSVRNEIIRYCFEDCDDCAIGYSKIVDQISPVAMGYWCEFHKSISRMELREIPCDYRTANLILQSRRDIADHLIDQVNATWPVFEDGTFKRKSFLAWCAQQNIIWPFKKSDTNGRPYRSFDDNTMKSMEALDPFIAQLRQTRKTLNAFKRKVSINIDGAHAPSLL